MTIRAVMLYLMATPRAYKALQAEIDEGIRAGRVSSPVKNAEAQEMPYLQVSTCMHQPHSALFHPLTVLKKRPSSSKRSASFRPS
jgi:hypothetical protein